MDLKVLWTTTAKSQLEDIFEKYKITADLTFAFKVVRGIVRKTASLSRQPHSGQREPLLTGRQKEYWHTVEGNCKIIYWIDEVALHIAAVFDIRQNPEAIEKSA